MELIDTWNINRYTVYVRCCTKQKILLDIKIHQSITLLLIFNHLSNVQLCLVYYNIEKSGFNAVSAYLVKKQNKALIHHHVG